MELHWTWYALAIVGVYRMITVCFEAVVRRTVRIAQESRSETETAAASRDIRRAAAPQHAFALYQDVSQLEGPADSQGER
ncbi:hypothetical protein OG730_43765 (plasmid) [Streptomyces sp. NBC_01298]|uniref:hypothetical protein n=1 Tax=Streptomyces sp. NBC_01298 TaxID=2903817 RepID=UPI002E127A36|nr:hypothetical protein OG730_43765 [Streptomyces sp. NBC_01298]